jgi:hypothetical protein
MKRVISIEDTPSLHIPEEVFDTVVYNMYSLVDVCHWYTCQKSTSHRWVMKHIESLLLLMYEKNSYMFNLTNNSYYIKNCYYISYTQEAIRIIPIMITMLPTFDTFMSPRCDPSITYTRKGDVMRQFFTNESEIEERDKKKVVPFSARQQRIFLIVSSYVKHNYGFEIFLGSVEGLSYSVNASTIFKKAHVDSPINFLIYPQIKSLCPSS